MDVTRQIETDSERDAERTINDCWNIDRATTSSGDWAGRIRFQVLRTRLLPVHTWVTGSGDYET